MMERIMKSVVIVLDGQGNVNVLSSQVAQELLAVKMNQGQRDRKAR
jgi:hypothetical protein